jgi:hypothetical protein
MVTIEYEQSLVETAVFLAVRHEERLECELHEVIDPLYEIPDEELRQREFVPVFREFFTKLGFDRLIDGLLAERPLVGELVDRCVVREAPRKKAESAELLVQSDEDNAARTLVFQICPQSFLDSGDTTVSNPLRTGFITLMRRELLHVADMLNEQFGYVREIFSGEPSWQNLQRDRYRVLWDTYVAGRLDREEFGDKDEKDRLERAFGRVFANCAAGTDRRVFTGIFDAPSLTHRNFMEWAREPASLLDSSPVPTQVAAAPACAEGSTASQPRRMS